jgi:chromosome condensin MukBEF MukE localization factor
MLSTVDMCVCVCVCYVLKSPEVVTQEHAK